MRNGAAESPKATNNASDAVAQEVAGERGDDEFVGEAATGDDEDGDDEGAVGGHGIGEWV